MGHLLEFLRWLTYTANSATQRLHDFRGRNWLSKEFRPLNTLRSKTRLRRPRDVNNRQMRIGAPDATSDLKAIGACSQVDVRH